MVKILPYNPKVKVLWSTPKPALIVTKACSVTQKGIFANVDSPSSVLIKFLLDADHGNPLEHAVICFDISQISRACADQLRTHRMCSPTMSSTHYQDHSDHPHRMPIEMCSDGLIGWVDEGLEFMIKAYNMTKHAAHAEARQILPLSIEVRYMLTINARSLAKMLPMRMCYRNTIETILCAERVRRQAVEWFPELFGWIEKPCVFGKCKEGKMACDHKAVEQRLMSYE